MRRDKVLRFVTLCFVIGAFLGLIFGLAFGGGGPSTPSPTGDTGQDSPAAALNGSQTDPSLDGPMTADRAEAIGANEMGQVLMLVYYQIGSQEDDTTRSPDHFREDLSLLESEGYYPVSVRDLVAGNVDIPAGRSPVVITFDGSSPGQYRILDDGSIDPDCAVGIMQDAARSESWAERASFFCLLDVVPKDDELFGQPERQKEKLHNLVAWGYEVGSHTVTNIDLSEATEDEAKKELAQSKATLEDYIGGGYAVTSLSVPYGKFPGSEEILASGQYEEISYGYDAVLGLDESTSSSPFSDLFHPLRLPRIVVTGDNLKDAIKFFKDHQELRYISDGDPTTVSAPSDLGGDLGTPREGLGRPLIRY